MGGRRVSGVRRTRYSHTEHRERWDKVGRFIMQSLKLLVLLILLLVVRSFELEHRVDIKRQRWTCDVLLFYNVSFGVAMSIYLVFKVSTNQRFLIFLTFLFGLFIVLFAYFTVVLFMNGLHINEDLPDEEVNRMPESAFLYAVFLACFLSLAFFVVFLTWIGCYVALVTYQMRGVLFQNDQEETEAANLRVARQASNMRRLEAIRSHKRPMNANLSQAFIRTDITCAICISEFYESEDIVMLECYSSHIFHYDCIENWIARGNRECPICRKVIHFLD